MECKKVRNSSKQRLGRWGEEIARAYLEEQGCQYIDKNVRTPDGEIDIVMKQNEMLVFVEVKTRRNSNFSYPEEAVTDEKIEHMEDSATWYLQAHSEYSTDWRIDVVAVIGSPGSLSPQIEWFQNAN